MYKKVVAAIIVVIFNVLLLSGCSLINKLEVKLGKKNIDFEYMKEGKANKILIQNIRDKGFSFTVTDKKAIKELYDILSSAKQVEEKSSLKPDYIFKVFQDGKNTATFNYIAGLDKEDLGNFYCDNSIYIVPKRIDNDILKNFWNIRKPKDFNRVYYDTIKEVINRYINSDDKNISKTKKIIVNINDDISIQKFLLSTELEDFKQGLKEISNELDLYESQEIKDFDVIAHVKTEGYSYSKFKAIITIENTLDNTESKYYVFNNHKNLNWIFQISLDKPEGF